MYVIMEGYSGLQPTCCYDCLPQILMSVKQTMATAVSMLTALTPMEASTAHVSMATVGVESTAVSVLL